MKVLRSNAVVILSLIVGLAATWVLAESYWTGVQMPFTLRGSRWGIVVLRGSMRLSNDRQVGAEALAAAKMQRDIESLINQYDTLGLLSMPWGRPYSPLGWNPPLPEMPDAETGEMKPVFDSGVDVIGEQHKIYYQLKQLGFVPPTTPAGYVPGRDKRAHCARLTLMAPMYAYACERTSIYFTPARALQVTRPISFTVPWVVVTLAFFIPPAIRFRWEVVQYAQRLGRYCNHCGYDLRESFGRCPECGTTCLSAAAISAAQRTPLRTFARRYIRPPIVLGWPAQVRLPVGTPRPVATVGRALSPILTPLVPIVQWMSRVALILLAPIVRWLSPILLTRLYPFPAFVYLCGILLAAHGPIELGRAAAAAFGENLIRDSAARRLGSGMMELAGGLASMLIACVIATTVDRRREEMLALERRGRQDAIGSVS